MRYFPAFLDLKARPALVVGGRATAARKVRLLRKAHAHVVVVAHSLDPELAGLAAAGTIEHQRREFRAGDVLGKASVIAATGLARVDEAVAEVARVANVPVNAVDRPSASTFITPALVDRASLLVAVSWAGAAPGLARRLRDQLEARLSEFADSVRAAVASRRPAGPARLRVPARSFDGPVAERADARADASEAGSVAIVGAGPGDPDLLTLKALRVLQRADVVVYDRLIAPEILDAARREAERVYVGKAAGAHATTQDQINALMVRHAEAGRRVVRLKGGDPFVFGRGGEEAAHLRARGLEVTVVPGITAAAGCAAAAGIPLTHRDHAHAVTLVTGHGKDPQAEPDWAALARGGQTLVIYMGVATAERTARALIAHGLAPDTPAAVIENGTTEAQRVLPTRLDRLAATVREQAVGAPALLVIGAVAAYADAAHADAAYTDAARAAAAHAAAPDWTGTPERAVAS